MNTVIRIASALSLVAVAACAADATAPVQPTATLQSGTTASAAGITSPAALVKCEARSGRSVISVDGKNLSPLNGTWTARVTSGGITVVAAARQGIGDEVEFDFSSQPKDIAAGATAIGASYIVVNPNGADVTAQIMGATGAVAVSGGADCRTR